MSKVRDLQGKKHHQEKIRKKILQIKRNKHSNLQKCINIRAYFNRSLTSKIFIVPEISTLIIIMVNLIT